MVHEAERRDLMGEGKHEGHNPLLQGEAGAEEAFAELERLRASWNGQERSPEMLQDAAYSFLAACGLTPTPDAVGQLTQVFLKCLRIMCERGYEPNGQLWRTAGKLGALADVRKKFFRLWNRAWHRRLPHDDSAIDLINYVGFYLRCEDTGWGDWGVRSEERRVGKECRLLCRSRWSPYH